VRGVIGLAAEIPYREGLYDESFPGSRCWPLPGGVNFRIRSFRP
jgi:hypothetical protein